MKKLWNKKSALQLLLILAACAVATPIILGLSARKVQREYCWAREVGSEGTSEAQVESDKIMKLLRNVRDPEIDINIVDLGLIYGVHTEGQNVSITMTLTTPSCPFAPELIKEVKNEVFKENVRLLRLMMTFDPPWTVDRLAPEVYQTRFAQARSTK